MDGSDAPRGGRPGDEPGEKTVDVPHGETATRSELGAPSVGEAVRDMFSADEVFQRIIAAADEEVTSGGRELFFSGVAAGFAISITFLLYASMSAETDSAVVASLLYPLGFIYIIIGGYQLYTENTLPPVALTLERLASLPALLRHWTIVLAGNFAGGVVGALVLAYGGVFDPAAYAYALDIARDGAFETEWWSLFFKGVFAGLIVAGVVWVSFASRDTISRLVVVYLAFLAIPLGNLFHVVVSFTEALFLLFNGEGTVVGVGAGFVLPVLLGNTIGGVALVTVVNYFQTSEHRLESARFHGIERRLSIREWAFGGFVGRSYVPLLDTAETGPVPGDDTYHVMVPVSNPRLESNLVEMACALASTKETGTVQVVHVVQTPRGMPLGGAGERRGHIVSESESQLDSLEGAADGYDVAIETSTVVSHRSFQEIFETARATDPDLVLLGWDESRLWHKARAETPLAELTNQLPCDFLVVRDRGLDASRVLLPTAGGPDSELSGEVARMLEESLDAEVCLLHVVDGPEERDDGERFLGEWAVDHGFEDAELRVDDSGDVETAIERAAEDHTMLVMGATERGMLSRLVTDSLHYEVVDEVDCSVLLAERPSDRSLRERLFGRGRRRE